VTDDVRVAEHLGGRLEHPDLRFEPEPMVLVPKPLLTLGEPAPGQQRIDGLPPALALDVGEQHARREPTRLRRFLIRGRGYGS
jgi:hypothetical protein